MTAIVTLFWSMLVKRFYARNSGLFVFVIVVMAGIVETITGDERMILTYHYYLIIGMIGNWIPFALVLFLWLLYWWKGMQFVLFSLSARDASFTHVINACDRLSKISSALFVQLMVYLPVLAYASAVIGIAVQQQHLLMAFIIVFFNVVACTVGSYLIYSQVGKMKETNLVYSVAPVLFARKYFSLLLRFIFFQNKFIFLATKLFSCLLLFAFLRDLQANDYDVRFLLMTFTIALAGHSVLIRYIRIAEEKTMTFYRQLPVSLMNRGMQYIVIYFVLLLPETWLIFRYCPGMAHFVTALTLVLYAFCFLLVQHAMLVLTLMPIRQLLKWMLCIFMVAYFFILAKIVFTLIVLLLVLSFVLFISRYYLFELEETT